MKTVQGFALFDTAIGRCGIAWSEHGVLGVQLPEADEVQTRARLRERFANVGETHVPENVAGAIDRIVHLLSGNTSDLSAVALDMSGVALFQRRVYEVTRSIAQGATQSYGHVAARIGAPRAARAVGQALGRNPYPILVPCHRALAAGAKIGGFSANGGVATKLRLLAIEGVQLNSTVSRS
jgi:methylated-DNA-[protein]-cysteine S-methyltransferase